MRNIIAATLFRTVQVILLPIAAVAYVVTMYLNREAVVDTLLKIAETAGGSVVAFDYFSAEMIHSRSLFMRYATVVLNAIGEPFGTFAIDNTPPAREQVAAFLKSCGLSLEEHHNFGQETGGKRAMAGFATAISIVRKEIAD